MHFKNEYHIQNIYTSSQEFFAKIAAKPDLPAEAIIKPIIFYKESHSDRGNIGRV